MMAEGCGGFGVDQNLQPMPPKAMWADNGIRRFVTYIANITASAHGQYAASFRWHESATMLLSSRRQIGDSDPSSAGTVGDAAWRGGSRAVVGMAANPLGAHQVGRHRVDR